MIFTPRRAVPPVILLLLLLVWYQQGTHWKHRFGPHAFDNPMRDSIGSISRPFYPGVAKPVGSNYSRILVVPKLRSEHVGWIAQELPGLEAAVYEIDNPSDDGRYQVPKNKGHEAMVYLTYIIDHYDKLPDTIIFAHAHRVTWHNNILLNLDTSNTLKRLRDDRVARQGYMNLRCHLDPGCPNWIHLDRAEIDFDNVKKPEERYFSFEVFQAMFPGERPPPILSQPCCAQFAVSRQRVLDNPKSQYEHLRSWLLATDLADKDSGRIFEYMWQYLFTRNAEHCPSMNSCYCDGYGICFGSASKLDAWLAKLKQREIIEAELDEAFKLGKEKAITAELDGRKWKLIRELESEKMEAYNRGEEEANRAIERERGPTYT